MTLYSKLAAPDLQMLGGLFLKDAYTPSCPSRLRPLGDLPKDVALVAIPWNAATGQNVLISNFPQKHLVEWMRACIQSVKDKTANRAPRLDAMLNEAYAPPCKCEFCAKLKVRDAFPADIALTLLMCHLPSKQSWLATNCAENLLRVLQDQHDAVRQRDAANSPRNSPLILPTGYLAS